MNAETVNISGYYNDEAVIQEVLAGLEAAVAADLDELRQAGEAIIEVDPRTLLLLENCGYMVDLSTGALLRES